MVVQPGIKMNNRPKTSAIAMRDSRQKSKRLTVEFTLSKSMTTLNLASQCRSYTVGYMNTLVLPRIR